MRQHCEDAMLLNCEDQNSRCEAGTAYSARGRGAIHQGSLSLIGKAATPLIVAGLEDLPLQGCPPALGLLVFCHAGSHALAAIYDDLNCVQGVLTQGRLEICLIHLHQRRANIASLSLGHCAAQ